MTSNTPHDPSLAPQAISKGRELREINSTELMQGDREIVIRHGEEAYRLSVTRNGKLILHK